MGATNTTTYYNLSQFVGTDKPAWLQDYNGDMLKIDTGINAAKVAADAAALDASAAQLDATTALGDITNTINPAITSLQTTVGNQGGAINTINSLIGNGTPTTTDQTIIGAINEINAEVGTLNSALTPTKIHDDGNVVVYRTGNVCVAEFVGATYNYTFNVGDANKPKTASYAPCRLKNPSDQYFNALAIVDASGTFYFANWDGATLPNGSMLGSITWIC